jgi:hypothetical protein
MAIFTLKLNAGFTHSTDTPNPQIGGKFAADLHDENG